MDVPNLVHTDELTLAGTLSHREAPRGPVLTTGTGLKRAVDPLGGQRVYFGTCAEM